MAISDMPKCRLGINQLGQMSHREHQVGHATLWSIFYDPTPCPLRSAFVCLLRTSPVCVAVGCSVLQCVAVCCSVLQCVAVCCSELLSIFYDPAPNSRHSKFVCLLKTSPVLVLQNGALCCMLQCVAVSCSELQSIFCDPSPNSPYSALICS